MPKERRRRRAEKRLSKRVSLESPFLLCPLRFSGHFRCFKSKPEGGREETDSPQTPFWTTVSPHDAFAAPLAHSERGTYTNPSYPQCPEAIPFDKTAERGAVREVSLREISGLWPGVSLGAGKRGHYERGLFTGGISRISKISKFSRISRKWPDSPLLSTDCLGVL